MIKKNKKVKSKKLRLLRLHSVLFIFFFLSLAKTGGMGWICRQIQKQKGAEKQKKGIDRRNLISKNRLNRLKRTKRQEKNKVTRKKESNSHGCRRVVAAKVIIWRGRTEQPSGKVGEDEKFQWGFGSRGLKVKRVPVELYR